MAKVGNPNHDKMGRFSSGPGSGSYEIGHASRMRQYATGKDQPPIIKGNRLGGPTHPNLKSSGHNAGGGNRSVAKHVASQHALERVNKAFGPLHEIKKGRNTAESSAAFASLGLRDKKQAPAMRAAARKNTKKYGTWP